MLRAPPPAPPSLFFFPSSHLTPPTRDRLEPRSATPRPFGHVSRPRHVSLATRYGPVVRVQSMGARPVLRTGRRALFRRARLRRTRLHEARYAVFAVPVTIPGALRSLRSLRAAFAGAGSQFRESSPPFGGSQSRILATGSALARHRRRSRSLPTSTASPIDDGSSLFERFRPLAPGASRPGAQNGSPPDSVSAA